MQFSKSPGFLSKPPAFLIALFWIAAWCAAGNCAVAQRSTEKPASNGASNGASKPQIRIAKHTPEASTRPAGEPLRTIEADSAAAVQRSWRADREAGLDLRLRAMDARFSANRAVPAGNVAQSAAAPGLPLAADGVVNLSLSMSNPTAYTGSPSRLTTVPVLSVGVFYRW